MFDPEDTGALGPHPDELEEIRLDLGCLAAPSELEPLVETMTDWGISAASQLDLRRTIEGVRAGSAWNGYTMARLQGFSREDARAHPATGALLAIRRFIGETAGIHELHRTDGFKFSNELP